MKKKEENNPLNSPLSKWDLCSLPHIFWGGRSPQLRLPLRVPRDMMSRILDSLSSISPVAALRRCSAHPSPVLLISITSSSAELLCDRRVLWKRCFFFPKIAEDSV